MHYGKSVKRRIFVDVSVLARRDAGTGIQRVVRSIWLQLSSTDQNEFEIVPIAGTKRGPYRRIRTNFLERPITKLPWPFGRARIKPRREDVFFGLDLSAHVAPRQRGHFQTWRRKGVLIIYTIYDILPVQRPEWFNAKSHEHFARWLDHVQETGDLVLCISQAVMRDFEAWASAKQPDRQDFAKRRPLIRHMRIEGTIAASNPSRGLPADADETLEWVAASQTILMVGTIEPRKGYAQALEAFDILWARSGSNAPQLLIVGQPGWKTEELQQKLIKRPAASNRLRWISDASDEYLELLYEGCKGLLVASHGEGLGLPLLEAMEHQKPILARDLPVFREVAPSAEFFTGDTPLKLANALEGWLDGTTPSACVQGHGRGWNTAVDDLMDAIATISR